MGSGLGGAVGGLAAGDGLVDESDPVGGDVVGPGPGGIGIDPVGVLQCDRVDLGFVAGIDVYKRQDMDCVGFPTCRS